MFSEIIGEPALNSNSIALQGQIRISQRLLGKNDSTISTALSAVVRYGEPGYRLGKSGLLNIWKDSTVPFASKCLSTLWWGHPDFRQANKVYSRSNIDSLNTSCLEDSLNSFPGIQEGTREFVSKIE